jgi:hypothetical protein
MKKMALIAAGIALASCIYVFAPAAHAAPFTCKLTPDGNAAPTCKIIVRSWMDSAARMKAQCIAQLPRQ